MNLLQYDQPKGKLNAFLYSDVKLNNGMLKIAYDESYEYYMNISVDDMLFELRKLAGIKNPDGATSLAAEEGSWFGNGANVLGQWLQAYARYYAATGKEEVKNKVDGLISGFKEIMELNPELGNGLWFYYFEKYLWGFVDCYVYCGNDDALILARKWFLTALNSPIHKNAKKILGDNGTPPEPKEIEWYITGEALLRYADVEQSTGNNDLANKAREYAKQVEYRQFWDIFFSKKNLFDFSPMAGQNTAYFHSYSHVNSFNSAAYFYKVTQDSYYLTAAKNFYEFMRSTQELVNGGYGAHLEWLMPKSGIINAIEFQHDSFETQCCSYAVYRLSNWLLKYSGSAEYGNWVEKLLYNATLASIPMDKAGHAHYYTDLNTQSSCKFLHGNTWTCCTGSRPLLLNELLKTIYFNNGNNLFVNLFVPSKISYNGMDYEQYGEYPYENIVRIKVKKEKQDGISVKNKLYFRVPETAAAFKVYADKIEVKGRVENGWACVKFNITNEVELSIEFNQRPVWHKIEMLGEGIAGINCGPVTLATQSDDAAKIFNFDKEADLQLEKIDKLNFKIKGTKIVFSPFMDYKKGENYHVYFRYRTKSK